MTAMNLRNFLNLRIEFKMIHSMKNVTSKHLFYHGKAARYGKSRILPETRRLKHASVISYEK